MTTWPVLANWTGPIVMIGFGSIGRGVLPLILRHIGGDKSRITILDPGTDNKAIADCARLRDFTTWLPTFMIPPLVDFLLLRQPA